MRRRKGGRRGCSAPGLGSSSEDQSQPASSKADVTLENAMRQLQRIVPLSYRPPLLLLACTAVKRKGCSEGLPLSEAVEVQFITVHHATTRSSRRLNCPQHAHW